MVAVTETSLLLQTPPGGALIDGYADFPGTAGNYLSTPDTAALDIVGDICIVARIAMDDWTPAATQTICAKLQAAGQYSYGCYVDSAGSLGGFTSPDGTNFIFYSSTIATGVANGAWKWVAWSLDVDNGAAGKTARFWLSDDGTTWVQLGADVTTASTTSIFSSTSQLELGSELVGTINLAGLLQHVSIRNGIGAAGGVGGTEVFRFDGRNISSVGASTITATSGATITVNKTAAPILVANTRPFSVPGAKIGSGDWLLHIERLAGDEDGGIWDLSEWATGAGDANPDVGLWAALGWESLNDVLRGMEWSRGADQPNGRPRNGEIALTLVNEMDGANDPWVNYGNVRPGTILRAGITSLADVRADGWIPLWTGIVESWTPAYEGARSSGYRADSFAEVRLIETLAWLARIDKNTLGSPVGSGETLVPRTDRLLVNAAWPYGMVQLFGGGVAPTIALQSTDMNANRLTELYLTADSTNAVIRPDVTGACLATDRSLHDSSRLFDFSFIELLPGFPFAGFQLGGADASGDMSQVAYDSDSVETVNDPEGIVNDHRYTRVGGTQQVYEHPVSIGQFGRSTRARSDLIMTTDGNALVVAQADNDRESRSALRVDAVTVVATARPNALLVVAAADMGDFIWFVPITSTTGFAGQGVGTLRSMSHTITPMKGRVHWTATYAIDFPVGFTNLPGAFLPAP